MAHYNNTWCYNYIATQTVYEIHFHEIFLKSNMQHSGQRLGYEDVRGGALSSHVHVSTYVRMCICFVCMLEEQGELAGCKRSSTHNTTFSRQCTQCPHLTMVKTPLLNLHRKFTITFSTFPTKCLTLPVFLLTLAFNFYYGV